jgi:hypothetical protein
MKTRVVLLITLILIFMSGCIETKVYLGREDQGDEQEKVYGAINPTTIPAGITWGTFRSYINENFEEVDLAIDTLDNGLANVVDSISAHRTAIQLRLLKSDSTIFASQHDLSTGLAGKQDTFTLKTVNGESLIGSGDITIEGGAGGTWGGITGTLADQEDLSDAFASKQDTSFRLSAIASLVDGSGQLTNDGYGNYSWAATGGTGTVTSVGLSVPTGFTVTNSPVTTNGTISMGFTSGYSLPMTADQVNWSSAYDWVNANGLLSISGSHSLIFRTTGSTDITLPTSGIIPNQQDVNNAIDNALASALSSAEPALAQSDTVNKVVTKTYLETRLSEFAPPGSFDTTYLHYRIDSLITVVENQATEIENLWNAIETLGDFDLTAPAFLSAELGSFADDTLVVLMDTTDVRQDSVPPLTAFTLWAGATEHGIAAVDIGHDTLYIALDSAGVYDATYTLDYTRGTPALQDSSGNKTANWIGRSVENNIAQPSEEPSFLASDGNTDFRYVAESQYITMATGVSQWQDISGSGWHLAQATGTAQPAFSEATGVSFDGTSDFLRNNSVAVSAPWTIYVVANITYAQFSTFFYFNELGSDRLYSMMPDEVNPTMELGSIAQNYVTNTWYVWTITMDGANSSIQLNDGTPTVASYTNAAIDLLSFASFEGTNWGNLRIKEVIGRAGADTSPNKAAVITYLMNKYAIE